MKRSVFYPLGLIFILSVAIYYIIGDYPAWARVVTTILTAMGWFLGGGMYNQNRWRGKMWK